MQADISNNATPKDIIKHNKTSISFYLKVTILIQYLFFLFKQSYFLCL